jgi:prepilin-type N-terminal cleavage/methylation domain-containing protein
MLRDNIKKQKNIKGFTLVEMLVAIAVFMIVMTVAVGSLVSIIDANRKAQAIKNVVNNINFALESISKDMRVGTDYYCHTSSGYENTDAKCLAGADGVRYKKSITEWVHYRYFPTLINPEDGNIKKCTKENCGDSDWSSLTAPTYNVQISNMKFYVLGTGTSGGAFASKRHPRAIITLEGTAGTKENIKTTFNIQTTVSQRAREL